MGFFFKEELQPELRLYSAICGFADPWPLASTKVVFDFSRGKSREFFCLACRRFLGETMPRLHNLTPGFQRGEQNVASPLRDDRNSEANYWFFHSNKLNRLLRIESDVLFFSVVTLEFCRDVVSYDSVPEGSPEAGRARDVDLVVNFATGKKEYWQCRRDPQNHKHSRRQRESNFRLIHAGDVELGRIRFDNCLLLSGAMTAARDYDCVPACQSILGMFADRTAVTIGEILSIADADVGLLYAALARLLAEGTLETEIDNQMLSGQSVVNKTASSAQAGAPYLPGVLGATSSAAVSPPTNVGGCDADASDVLTCRARRLIPPEYLNATWATPSLSEIPNEKRAKYSDSKRIVDAYRRGDTYRKISDAFRVSVEEIARLVKRCVEPCGDGGIYGYYGLIPGRRFARRKATSASAKREKGGSYAWTNLLENVEGLADSINQWVLDGGVPTESKPLDMVEIHRLFRAELHKAGLGESDYPLSNFDRGQDALYRHVRQIKKTHLVRYTRIYNGETAEQRARYLGRGHRRIIRPSRPGSFAQLDYWRTDNLSKITVDNGFGEAFESVLPKWYYAVMVDELYSFVMAGFPTLEKTPSTESALETLDRFVHPDKYRLSDFARDADIDTLGPCFSPELVAQMRGGRFDVLRVDNAWANLSDAFIRAAVYQFGAAVNFGPTYTWVTRAVVERVIRNISQLVKKSIGSEAVPTLEQLRYALDEACLDHNITGTERLHNSSPVTALKDAIRRQGDSLVVLPLPRQTIDHGTMLDHYFVTSLRGNTSKDVRPIFQHFRRRYESDVLGAYSELLRVRGKRSSVGVNGGEKVPLNGGGPL
ncbi:putative by FrameD [Caballeronia sordidicola]|uniref:Putative by FrameD n=2 Tax=Caballeronia sordidicola TaxID=196367 RepID=A0A226WP77_CABSO|nr:putative by FrameD [Caballeronia sordidicola]